MAQLSVIIPVYNEGNNILRTLAAIDREVMIPHECLIVYDFEKDDTLTALAPVQPDRENLRLIKNRLGRGVLNAIKTGFEAADAEVMLVTMADLSDDLAAVPAMFDHVQRGADVVCGSRYMPGGRQIGGPLVKGCLSRLAGLSLYHFFRFPVHDLTNSFKMYTRNVLSAVEIQSTGGFEIGMEIVVKAYLAGFRIAEVPTVWRDRTAGQSRFQLFKWIPRYAYWYGYAVAGILQSGNRHGSNRRRGKATPLWRENRKRRRS
ncbi:MAG: glycosyltransferase [Desulfobacterales bacterium]